MLISGSLSHQPVATGHQGGVAGGAALLGREFLFTFRLCWWGQVCPMLLLTLEASFPFWIQGFCSHIESRTQNALARPPASCVLDIYKWLITLHIFTSWSKNPSHLLSNLRWEPTRWVVNEPCLGEGGWLGWGHRHGWLTGRARMQIPVCLISEKLLFFYPEKGNSNTCFIVVRIKWGNQHKVSRRTPCA